MALRVTLWVAAGLILGFVLGGVPARREAKAMRVERDALQAKLDSASRPNFLQALLPSMDSRPAEDGHADDAHAGDKPPSDPAPPANANVSPEAPRKERPSLEQFDQFVIAQRARSAAARAALIEQAGLDATQIARVDDGLSRMNGKLLGYGEEIVALAEAREAPGALQMLSLGHDVSGILYEGQRELEAAIGAAGPSVDRSALEIWTYVDVEQWRPIVKDKLSALGAAGSSAVPAR